MFNFPGSACAPDSKLLFHSANLTEMQERVKYGRTGVGGLGGKRGENISNGLHSGDNG